MPRPLPHVIDSSMLVMFRSCPRKYFWEHLECLRPSGRAIDLTAGGAFAAGIEAAYQARFRDGKSDTDALAAAYRAFAAAWGDEPDPDPKRSTKSFASTFQALLGYFIQWPFDRDPVRPMMLEGNPTFEFSFALPLLDPRFPRHPDGAPFLYSGRFDAFGLMDGRLVIRDEKTSGRAPDRHWSDKWTLRNQFLGYCWAATQSGFPTNTVVVRNVTIQKTQSQYLEAIKIFPQITIDRFVDQLARDLHRLVDCYTSGYFDYDFGDACTAFNRPCAFMDLCSAEHPEDWFSLYNREVWDPLTRTSVPFEEAA